MPRKVFDSDSEGDGFETEALQSLNVKKKIDKSQQSGSEDSESGSDDDNAAPDQDEGSDDEAPESVGFSDSRNTILAQLKSAMVQVDQEKHKRKEKRKQQETLYKSQKEKKMKYIEETKLPDDILDNIDEAIPTVKQSKQLQKNKQTKKDGKKGKTKAKIPIKDETLESHPAGEDYIPFVDEDSGVAVTEVRSFEQQHKSLAQKAADFRNSRLFSKDIPRESNKARLLKNEKKRQRVK